MILSAIEREKNDRNRKNKKNKTPPHSLAIAWQKPTKMLSDQFHSRLAVGCLQIVTNRLKKKISLSRRNIFLSNDLAWIGWATKCSQNSLIARPKRERKKDRILFFFLYSLITIEIEFISQIKPPIWDMRCEQSHPFFLCILKQFLNFLSHLFHCNSIWLSLLKGKQGLPYTNCVKWTGFKAVTTIHNDSEIERKNEKKSAYVLAFHAQRQYFVMSNMIHIKWAIPFL